MSLEADLKPMPISKGPPFPVGLDAYLPFKGLWPWYKAPKTIATLISIAVTPASASITVGSTQQFRATGNYSDGSTKEITSQVVWEIDTVTYATITSGGLVTGLEAGSANITASLSEINSDVVFLTVVAATPVSGGSFTISVINAPSGSIGWNCAIQDPVSGDYYQWLNNAVERNGLIYLLLTDQAIFTGLPISSGKLSISACSGGNTSGQFTTPIILAQDYVDISFENGGTYTFDFSTQQFNQS